MFWELFRLETVSMRYFNVYGPRQRPDSQYAAVIPLFIHALRHDEQPEIHGDGRQSRHFAYITDVVEANIRAASAPAAACAGKAFNIAGGEPFDLLELLAELEAITGVTATPRFTDPRAGDVRHTHADLTAARESLSYEPVVSSTDGLRRTVDWFAERDINWESA